MASIVILNGVSSSGKTTLARAIQRLASTDYLRVEMDSFISMLPIGSETKHSWFDVTSWSTADGHLTSFKSGPSGASLLEEMRGFVAGLANRGFDVVVDDVCKRTEIEDYQKLLEGHQLKLVAVTASLEQIEARERSRGDRIPGLAREQIGHLHEGISYDLEVDTEALGPEEAAQEILKLVSLTASP